MPSPLLRALEQARHRLGSTGPNPSVGAVLVRDGEVVGEGYHWGAGYPHAEVVAAERAGERARGATLYVTLEPCCHWGRTPPCTDLIREVGIARVYYGFPDPNPRVNGGGEEALRRAGIPCERLDCPETVEFYRPYGHWTRTGEPWVTAKLALTLDGRVPRERVTGEEAAARTHRGRREADAILTAIGTVLADDPRLDAREGEGRTAKPVYVLDSLARLPLNARLWEHAGRLTLLHGPDAPPERLEALRARGAATVALDPAPNGLSLAGALKAVGEAGHHGLWVEAGGRLFASLLEARRVHRALLYVAPRSAEGAKLSDYPELWARLEEARRVRWTAAGRDAVGTFEFSE